MKKVLKQRENEINQLKENFKQKNSFEEGNIDIINRSRENALKVAEEEIKKLKDLNENQIEKISNLENLAE